ncbi:MAG: TfpX/TfpZ family type IV pilin accessory protein [Burkholderiales bacterium]|jgi:hypothetical protein
MLRRAADPSAASPQDALDRPLITGLPTPRPPAPARRSSGLRERMRAAGIHLLICLAVAAVVSVVVFGAWYPGPMPSLLGVGAILAIVIGVDVIVGPIFTLLVFDRSKPRLKWDLTAIGVVQIVALIYGVHTLYQGRPAFIVLAKDRFEVTSPADLRPEDREAARDNPHAKIDPLRPRWIAARLPESQDERMAISLEALSNGRDIQHHPKLYVDYASERDTALERALPIARLRTLNPGRAAEIDALVAASGRAEGDLRYLPLRGPANDGAVLIDAKDASVVTLAALVPW